MSDTKTIDILNELLEREATDLVWRLREATCFVSWASTDEGIAMARLAGEVSEHQQWLVDTIHDLGGEPLPIIADINTSNLHFLEFDYVMPQVIEEKKQLLAAYEMAAGCVGGNPRAAEVISRIADRHRRHLDQLIRLTAKAQAISSATSKL